MMRPQPARWFEILAARDDAALVLAALAATGAVELETRSAQGLPESLAAASPLVDSYLQLQKRYRAYWPASGLAPSPFPDPPVTAMQRTLECVSAWAAQAEPLILRLQRCEAEAQALQLWRRIAARLGDAAPDLRRLAEAGPVLAGRLFVCPPDRMPALPAPTLACAFDLDEMRCVLVLAPAPALDDLVRQVAALKGQVHAVPAWLGHDAAQTLAYIARRSMELEEETARLQLQLEAAHRRHGLRRALGDAARLQWVMENVHALESTGWLTWITGWSSDMRGRQLAGALAAMNGRALLHFPAPPAGRQPPLLLRNPWWAKPFEVFARAAGMPGRNEADPSRLLAVAVPLMFGYMFGDVGQGLVIAAAAFLLRRRWALARLFIAGGLSAAIFGLLFGSVFSLENVFPALWLHPLAQPLAVLLVPLAGGVLLLGLGLALRGVEAAWRGELRAWLLTDAGLAAVYLGLLGGLADRSAWALAAAGVLASCVGAAVLEGRPGAAIVALASLVERVLQLVVNSLSFARVGAFALAHAGLSSAVVALAEATGNPLAAALLLVLGNVLVIALEALVVSVQTTRLVLFEFFTRFLVAEGRPFRPLPPPPYAQQER